MAEILKTLKYPLLKRGYHRMTLAFGNTYSDGSFHKGIDITGNTNTDSGYDYIVTPFAGTVVSCQNSIEGQVFTTQTPGMGNYVRINCGNGVYIRFMHMKKGSVTIKKGQTVKAGATIGYIGNTGNSSGRHLHFDLCVNGTYVNPLPYLRGETPLSATHYVNTSALNVRSGPGLKYKVVDEIKRNTKVTVYETSGSWSRIGTDKWVSTKYIKKVGE